jgi:HEAT repeat protein
MSDLPFGPDVASTADTLLSASSRSDAIDRDLRAVANAGLRSLDDMHAYLASHDRGELASQVVWLVGYAGNRRSTVPRVIELLVNSPDEQVRLTAVETLRRLGGARAAKALDRTLTGDDTPDVRALAAHGLGSLLSEPEALFSVASNETEHPKVRAGALEALTFVWRDSMLPTVLTALRDPHAEVRMAAAYALGRCGGPDSIAELERLQNDQQSVPGLGSIGEVASMGIEQLRERGSWKSGSGA